MEEVVLVVSASANATYTISELSSASEVPVRTIRYYQSEGLLPRPAHRGTQAVYSQDHLAALRSIANLRERGLKLQTIRSMLSAEGSLGQHLIDLLGPDLVGSAWLATSARTLSEGELADLLGEAYPEQVPALVTAGYLQRRSDGVGRGVWYAPSLPQLRGALELWSLGTSISLSGWAADLMRERLGELCRDYVERWLAESQREFEGGYHDLVTNLEAMRAIAWQTAAHVMAEEIERAIVEADPHADSSEGPGAPGVTSQ